MANHLAGIIGRAFQIQDDILDIEGTEEEWITKISDIGSLADRVDNVEETLEWKLDV